MTSLLANPTPMATQRPNKKRKERSEDALDAAETLLSLGTLRLRSDERLGSDALASHQNGAMPTDAAVVTWSAPVVSAPREVIVISDSEDDDNEKENAVPTVARDSDRYCGSKRACSTIEEDEPVTKKCVRPSSEMSYESARALLMAAFATRAVSGADDDNTLEYVSLPEAITTAERAREAFEARGSPKYEDIADEGGRSTLANYATPTLAAFQDGHVVAFRRAPITMVNYYHCNRLHDFCEVRLSDRRTVATLLDRMEEDDGALQSVFPFVSSDMIRYWQRSVFPDPAVYNPTFKTLWTLPFEQLFPGCDDPRIRVAFEALRYQFFIRHVEAAWCVEGDYWLLLLKENSEEEEKDMFDSAFDSFVCCRASVCSEYFTDDVVFRHSVDVGETYAEEREQFGKRVVRLIRKQQKKPFGEREAMLARHDLLLK